MSDLYLEYPSTPRFKATKTCGSCNTEYPFTYFYISRSRDGYLKLEHQCKACTRVASMERKYKKIYGMSDEDIKDLKTGVLTCKICNTELENPRFALPPSTNGNKKKPMNAAHVDHNHATGEFRGFLCHSCNVGLGCFKDNDALLEKALRYIRD